MRTTETISFKEADLHVTFDFYKGDPGVHTYSNGDPGYPPTDDDIEIISVEIGPYDVTDLVECYFDEITEILFQKHEDYKNNKDY
jgi:hypothetical protein